MTLSGVYHAPSFGDVRLVSLRQLEERGASYCSSPSGVTVVKGERVVLYGDSVGRLCRLKLQSAALITTHFASRVVSLTAACTDVPTPDLGVTEENPSPPQSQMVAVSSTALRTATETLQTWHCCLGHLNEASIHLL